MRALLRTIFAALIGGLVVFGATTYLEVPQEIKYVREVSSKPATGFLAKLGGETLTPQEIYEKYSDGVVHIRATVTSNYDDYFGLPIPDNKVSSGSGFIISDEGHVITNAHVVGGAQKIEIQLADDTVIPAELVGVDQSTDLAVLKANFRGHKSTVLSLGNSKDVKVGQSVLAIGNPLGLDRSMSSGIVSALKREIRAPNGLPIKEVIQTDTAINRGNSGGPLISAEGRVIGVTAQIATEGAGNIGIAFAIPSSTVKKVFKEIKETGKASHPWLGIFGTTIFPEMSEALELKTDTGVMVVSVLTPSPAQKAGLKGAEKIWRFRGTPYEVGGDIITKINKIKVSTMDDLQEAIGKQRVGEEINIQVLRNNKQKSIKISLEERPADPPISR